MLRSQGLNVLAHGKGANAGILEFSSRFVRYMSETAAAAPGERRMLKSQLRDKNIDTALSSEDLVKASKVFVDNFKAERAHHFVTDSCLNLFRQVHLATIKHKRPQNALSTKEMFGKYLDGGVAIGWMCSYAIMEDVLAGEAQKGLESWVRFLETLGNTEKAAANVNRDAALSALVAYVANCYDEGIEVDPNVALRLVPLKRVPMDNQVLALSGIKSLPQERINQIIEGVRKVRLHGLDFNSVEFLKSIPTDAPKEIEDKYNEALAKAEETGIPFSPTTYSRFISCFAESTKIQTAFDIWNDMLSKNVTPTIECWNSLLKAGSLHRGERVTIVEQIWAEMEKNGVQPDAESYSTLIDLHFKSHNPDKALEIFDKIQSGEIADIPVSYKIFNVVVNGLLKLGEVESAEALLKQGQTNGLSLGVMTYNTFLRTYIDRKEYAKAQTLIDDMAKSGVEPDVSTYTNVIDATFKLARQYGTVPEDIIESLLTEMSSKGIKANTVAMTSIISGLIKSANDIEAARTVFNKLLQKRLSPNARTFSTIIDGELTIGNMDQALYYFNIMEQHNLRKLTSIYNQIINWFVRKDQLDRAYKIFTELLQDRNTGPNKFSYYFILKGCDSRNKTQMAQSVINELAKERPDFDLGEFLPTLIKNLSQSGVQVPTSLLEKCDNTVVNTTIKKQEKRRRRNWSRWQ
jgi:pentatricopeptide repeat protein